MACRIVFTVFLFFILCTMYMTKQYDIIIIGSGMAGLYSAYNIQKYAPETTFLILEKYKRQWLSVVSSCIDASLLL